ncbi:transposase [Methanosphaera sp. ISO3-F5]|uniref:transposase n=1 Tax=Methanosphaera sp. ISO3-F5 TaxID=1452353 RepID=UPI002B25B8D8|nr:transposase [Methanosphaera sp. ISO3-F5]WQH63945.1 transposase [Methanosphaera sp. ISO3-F5]
MGVQENSIIVLFDEASFLNAPYTSRSLYKKGTKHIQKVNPYKIKVNATGSLAINGNSSITITNSSTAPEVAIALINLRITNTINQTSKKQLESVINQIQINDEDLDKILIKNSEEKTKFTDKIMKAIEKYEEDPTSTLARIIGKHCKRESLNNITKRRALKRKITIDKLNNHNIKSQMIKEETIYLILDNYSVHKSEFIKKVAKILNIKLIYLPPYSPHLNPIEQLWRKMKNIIKQYLIKSDDYLEKLVIKTFEESLINHHFTDEWYIKFITKVW